MLALIRNVLYNYRKLLIREVNTVVTSLNVANSVLDRARLEGIEVSHMKLQKMIYFIYKKYLELSGTPLFSERFESWAYGPVVPVVYDVFKSFKDKPINKYYRDAAGKSLMIDPKKDCDFAAALEFVWRKYADKNGIELSDLTHKPGTAWYLAKQRKEECLRDEDIKGEVWL